MDGSVILGTKNLNGVCGLRISSQQALHPSFSMGFLAKISNAKEEFDKMTLYHLFYCPGFINKTYRLNLLGLPSPNKEVDHFPII
jgi:hypothetical protein